MNAPIDDQYRAPRAGYQGSGVVIYEDIKVFSFSQRLNRLRFACYAFTSYLIMVLVFILGLILGTAAFGNGQSTALYMSLLIIACALVWIPYYISLLVRRLHDMGKSGWMAILILSPLLVVPLYMFDPTAATLAFLVSIISPLFNLYLLAGAGDGMNRYGTPNEPNSVLVNIFGGFCWTFSVLVLLLNLAFLSLEYAAPDKLMQVMRQLPVDQRVLEQQLRQYR